MKTRENEFFKAIDFEAVFDECLNECEKTIDCVKPFRIDGRKYGVDIEGSLLTGLTKTEVFDLDTGKNIDIDHKTLLKWANIELDKYVERNYEAIKRTFPYQFEPMPTDGVRIL